MKAVRLQDYGDVNQFRLEDAPEPTPKAGEVVIEVAASGLNPVDLYIRQGYMKQYTPMDLPAIQGIDAAGTITALGEKSRSSSLSTYWWRSEVLGGRAGPASSSSGALRATIAP